MGELDFATSRSVAARIRAKEVSPLEVLDHYLARVDALNDTRTPISSSTMLTNFELAS